jgi:hypothetical protein
VSGYHVDHTDFFGGGARRFRRLISTSTVPKVAPIPAPTMMRSAQRTAPTPKYGCRLALRARAAASIRGASVVVGLVTAGEVTSLAGGGVNDGVDWTTGGLVVGVVVAVTPCVGGLRIVLAASTVSVWRADGNGAYPAGSWPTFTPGV